MRIKWSEKARLLAEKHELYDNGSHDSDIEMLLRFRPGIKAVGIKTDDGKTIWFSINEENTIQAEVRLR